MRKNIVLSLQGIFFLLMFNTVWAQIPRPVNDFRNWEFVSSEFFDVYYPIGNEIQARKVAQYAERSRVELVELYDFRADLRYSLIYSNSALEIMNANFGIEKERQDPGIFTLPNRSSYVIHPGNSKDLYDEIKKKVSDLILEEFAYGNRLSSAIQSQILLNNPSWFWQGLSEYVSSGWTFEDEMWISSVRNEDILELALEGQQEISRTLRKSVWHYISQEYGEEKISEIIYLVNVSNSIESGIISVLGIQIGTFSERWREYVKDLADINASKRVTLSDIPGLKSIPFKKGYQLTDFAFNAPTNQLALQLHKEGLHQLFIYNIESEQLEVLPIQSGYAVEGADKVHFDLPLAWDHTGERIASVQYKNKLLYVSVYDFTTKDVTQIPVSEPLKWITELNWSHDGSSILLSALDGDGSDIYLLDVEQQGIVPVIDDPYDNLYPTWSLDDKYIFFSSNREPQNQELDREALADAMIDHHEDLFMLEMTSENGELTRLTNTPTIDESQPYPISSFEIGYLSNASGINNLYRLNVFLREFEPLTNLGKSISSWSGSEGKAFLASPEKGMLSLFTTSLDALSVPRMPETTLLRENFDLAFQARRNQKRQAERQQQTQQQEPQKPTPPETRKQQTDSTKDDDDRVRYYLFDEGDEYEVQQPSRRPVFSPGSSPISSFRRKELPKLSEIIVEDGARAKSKWSSDYIGWGIYYDPIAKFGVDMKVGFSDLLNKHRLDAFVRPYINLKNWEGAIRYSYLPHRVDFYTELTTRSRRFRQESVFFPQDSLIFRFDQFQARVGAIYPITSKIALEASAGYFRLNRIDQKLLRPVLQDSSDNAIRANLRLSYDNVKSVEGYPYKGFAANLGFDSYYSLEQSEPALNIASMQMRYYWEIHNKIVLAVRLNSSITLFDDIEQCNFVGEGGTTTAASRCLYYLGGVDNRFLTLSFEKDNDLSITGNPINLDLYGFNFQDFVTPVRGFWFNSRAGNKYVLGNFELRLPVSRLLTTTLNSGPLYNVDLIPFFDVGTVWSEGNPFTQKNPTDTRIVGSSPVTVELKTLKSPFLFTVGSGIRANLIGYSVRIDMAWGIEDNTLQKPMLHASFGKNF